MRLSSVERSAHAQRASQVRWRQEPDRAAATFPARQAFLRRFEYEVDPELRLPQAERTRLAHAARARYMQTLRARQSGR